jgi:hypothetical protein
MDVKLTITIPFGLLQWRRILADEYDQTRPAARAAIQQSDTPLPEDASLATIFARAIRILNEDLSIEEEREW